MAAKREDNIKIHPSAVVCKEAILQGTIEIGENTVVHPNCEILALGGPIVIGANNLLEEQVKITTRPEENNGMGMAISIGNNNMFEVGAHIEAAAIGNSNVVECRASLHPGCLIGNGCVVGAAVVIPRGELLEDNTIVFGSSFQKRTDPELLKRNTADIMPRISMLKKTLQATHKLHGH